ncbi:MAG: class I SAM-dependent methyltransferase [Elusimicrobiota bacterium]|nr:class I SAM-dependent methyltransferase [Elusimicrobiota bacterium]
MLPAYSENYRRLWEEHWWWQARRRFVDGWLDSLSRRRPLKRILDVGCGDGLYFDRLSRYGEPWGVENDASLVDPDGKWASRIRVEAFDGGFRDERRYDLVLMLDSLEHIEDDRSAAARAAALLEPGGFLFVTVPALPSLWSVHDEANRHFRRYTRETLGAALESAGLAVERMNYYFGWALLPLYARKLVGGSGAADYAVKPPPSPVNALLYAASVAEQALTGRGGTPCGSSLFALARRPEAA